MQGAWHGTLTRGGASCAACTLLCCHLLGSRLVTVCCTGCRWGSERSQVPVVRFLNGRELPIGPELFSADVAGVGTCKRTQVSGGGGIQIEGGRASVLHPLLQ